ncbi:MAG: hypothetical protein ACK40G_10975 [Cytophagaceae bacterium]
MDFKKFLRRFVPQFIKDYRKQQYFEKLYTEWQAAGCPVPPPHIVKQKTIQRFHELFPYDLFIETGTFLGDMVDMQKKRFKKIISIELQHELFVNAKNRFKKYPGITILEGDSGKVLNKIMPEINDPAIFWLDGHYSGFETARGDKDCPIYEELAAIFSGKELSHVILIDDARCFTGEGDYPKVEALASYIKSKDEQYHIEVIHDIICCHKVNK